MGKTFKKRRIDEYEDYDDYEDLKQKSTNRRNKKRLQRALKVRDIDALIESDELEGTEFGP